MYRKLEKEIRSETFILTYRPFEQKWINYFADNEPLNVKDLIFPHLNERYLAHGSYGACAVPLQEIHREWINEMEKDPNYFYYDTLYPYLLRSIRTLSQFVHTDPTNLVLVKNVEYGIQSVISSVLKPGDKVAVLDFNYEAIVYATERIVGKDNIIKVTTKLPVTDESLLFAIEGTLRENSIKMLILEHISSPSAIVLPVDQIGRLCRTLGVLTLVDGAHGVGQFDLFLEDSNVDFYTSNFHKWMYSPRGCGFLYIHSEQSGKIHPPITSWGANQGQLSEFIWQGTDDYAPFLCIPLAILLHQWLKPVLHKSKELATWTADYLGQRWNTDALASNSTMISMILPPKEDCLDNCRRSDLHDDLLKNCGIQVPVFTFKGLRCIRISIAPYNTRKDIESLAEGVLKFQ
jgi:isopenicillin-N epimerase